MEKNIEKLIVNYLENSISEEELNSLKNWISQKENERLYRSFVETYYRNVNFDAKRAFKLFESRTLDKKPLKLQKRKRFSFIKYAAIFVGVLASGYLIYFNRNPSVEGPPTEVTLEVEGGSTQTLNTEATKDLSDKNGQILAKQNGNTLDYASADPSETDITFNVLKVPYGKTFQVLLSDNTQVYLNAGSRLRYPNRFRNGGPREVFLKGEAYFKFSKNGDIPFLVRTDNASTEVFGTEFNVSSYPDDETTKIVLVEGSVGVFGQGGRFNSGSGVVLKPNEMASKIGKGEFEVDIVDVSGHIAWIDGTLLFKNEKFESIVKKLQRHYDVIITNNNLALREKRFTGRFDIESVEQILRTFQKTNNFNYIIDNNQIIINP